MQLHPYQRAIIRRIYGFTAEDGSPIVRTAAIWIPRGNAKTTIAAGLGLGHFMGPMREAGGQVVCAAADRENAGIAFNCSLQFAKQDPVLFNRIRAQESRKTLIHPGSKSTLKAIGSEAYSKMGLSVSFFLADEVRAWPPAEARNLWKAITDSQVKRRHPLTVVISTAGSGTGGLAHDLWTYSLKVASGEVVDPSFVMLRALSSTLRRRRRQMIFCRQLRRSRTRPHPAYQHTSLSAKGGSHDLPLTGDPGQVKR